jgi:cytoskeletal protein RodZ
VKEPVSSRPPSSDDRRTFESALDSARKKVTERNYNGAVEDCKLAMSILRQRTPSLAIQHSISECLECMADAYFASQQHEHALSKYEEAFQMRGKVFQRVEKPMMELLFKLEKTLGAMVASGHHEKFNQTENRWKAFVLSAPPGQSMKIDDNIIPGQNNEELQHLWKRVVKKQKSEARLSRLINRFSMPSLLIPVVIVFILLIGGPLCFFYIKGATDAAKDKADVVDTGKAGGATNGAATDGTTTKDETPDTKDTKVGSAGNTQSEHGSGASGTSGTSGTSGSSAVSGASGVAISSVPSSTTKPAATTTSTSSLPTKSEVGDWFEVLKRGNVAERSFSTADKNLDWKFQTDKTVHIKNGTLGTVTLNYYADGGDYSNVLAVFERTVFHKCYWLSIARFGLMDAGGTNYFDTSLPEFNTLQQMTRLALQSKDLVAMKKIGGENVVFKSLPGKTADAIIAVLKPELATKKPFSIVCVNMIDLKKKTNFVIGLDRNRNLLPAGRNGRNYVLSSDVDFSKQMLPDYENIVITDNAIQQARFRSVMFLGAFATAFLVICTLVKSRNLKYIGIVFMVVLIILALIALANTVQSIGLQKVR